MDWKYDKIFTEIIHKHAYIYYIAFYINKENKLVAFSYKNVFKIVYIYKYMLKQQYLFNKYENIYDIRLYVVVYYKCIINSKYIELVLEILSKSRDYFVIWQTLSNNESQFL